MAVVGHDVILHPCWRLELFSTVLTGKRLLRTTDWLNDFFAFGETSKPPKYRDGLYNCRELWKHESHTGFFYINGYKISIYYWEKWYFNMFSDRRFIDTNLLLQLFKVMRWYLRPEAQPSRLCPERQHQYWTQCSPVGSSPCASSAPPQSFCSRFYTWDTWLCLWQRSGAANAPLGFLVDVNK